MYRENSNSFKFDKITGVYMKTNIRFDHTLLSYSQNEKCFTLQF